MTGLLQCGKEVITCFMSENSANENAEIIESACCADSIVSHSFGPFLIRVTLFYAVLLHNLQLFPFYQVVTFCWHKENRDVYPTHKKSQILPNCKRFEFFLMVFVGSDAREIFIGCTTQFFLSFYANEVIPCVVLALPVVLPVTFLIASKNCPYQVQAKKTIKISMM